MSTGPTAGLRTATEAWRELLRTSHALLRDFEEAGDFGPLSNREYDVLRALAEDRGAGIAEHDAGGVGSGGPVRTAGVDGSDGGVGSGGSGSSGSSDGAAGGGPGLRLGALAEVAYLPQPSMSRLVERLERRGLLERRPCPGDGRGVLVALTPAGAALQREIGRRHVRSIRSAMTAALDAEELRTLTTLLRRVRESRPTPRGTTP